MNSAVALADKCAYLGSRSDAPNITFIAATPDLFGPYISYVRDDGYTVALAASVGEATTQAEALCPDLVFLDHRGHSPRRRRRRFGGPC